MSIRIKGKFIESSTLNGEKIELSGTGSAASLRYKDGSGNVHSVIQWNATDAVPEFKANGAASASKFASQTFVTNITDTKAATADVLTKAEYVSGGLIKEEKLPAAVVLESEILESNKIKESLLPDAVVLESEILDAGKLKASLLPEDAMTETEYVSGGKILASKLPDDAMLESEYMSGGLIREDKIAAEITRDSEIMDGSGKFLTSKLPALAITSVSVVTSEAARDALTAQEGDIAVVNVSGQPTRSYIKDSAGAWQELLTPGVVTSVNGETGAVSLTTTQVDEGTNQYYTQARFDSAFGAKSTSDLAEGSNKYFTEARAKSAAVVNSSAGSETDQAMSVSAGKAYADGKVIISSSVDDKTQAAEDRDTVAPSIKGMKDWVHANARVLSVNTQEGAVVLDADDILEAATNPVNLYFTEARALAAITGAASSIKTADLSASKALVSDANGKVAASSLDSSKLAHLSDVTSAIQAQLDAKAAKSAINAAVNALHVKEEKVISAANSATYFVKFPLAHKPAANSVVASVGRLMLQEGVDYDVAEVSGSWQLTFKGSILQGQDEALENDDHIHVKYMKELALA